KGSQLQSLGLGALEGMSVEELSQVVNFMTLDVDDYYSIQATAGQWIDLRTFTPGDGLGKPNDAVNPFVSLYSANGGLIAIDGGSASDGRNAHLRIAAPSDGLFVIHVGSTSGSGEYLLQAMTLS